MPRTTEPKVRASNPFGRVLEAPRTRGFLVHVAVAYCPGTCCVVWMSASGRRRAGDGRSPQGGCAARLRSRPLSLRTDVGSAARSRARCTRAAKRVQPRSASASVCDHRRDALGHHAFRLKPGHAAAARRVTGGCLGRPYGGQPASPGASRLRRRRIKRSVRACRQGRHRPSRPAHQRLREAAMGSELRGCRDQGSSVLRFIRTRSPACPRWNRSRPHAAQGLRGHGRATGAPKAAASSRT